VASRSVCGCVGVGWCSGGAASARLSVGVVFERASTGRLAGALVWGLGLWLGWDAGICVRAWDSKASALATGSRRQRRSVRPSAHERRIVGALGGGVGSASSFSWTGPREGRTSATSDPVGGGFSTCTALTRWQIHRWPAQSQNLASSASHSPRTRAAAAPSGPVEALSERRTSRSRADAAPPEREAAPTQPRPSEKPRQRTPTRARSRADATPTRARSHADAPHAARTAPHLER
jgi:hypothetical protein